MVRRKKRLGEERVSPLRDLTVGSISSRGPASVFHFGWCTSRPRCRYFSRHIGALSFSSLPAEGLRALVSAVLSAKSLLQRAVSARCRALASLVCEPSLAFDGAREGVSSGAEPPLSGASTSARTGRFGYRCRGCSWRANERSGVIASVRGPAPSACGWAFLLSGLCASGLLRLVRSFVAFAVSTFLFVVVPLGFTSGFGSRSEVASSSWGNSRSASPS